MHPLGGLGLEVHEIGQALGAGIGQPLVNRDTVARGFGDLLPIGIQEQFIGEMVRRPVPQDAADFVIDRRIGAVILAIHLKIDPKRRPARAKVRFPLQLHIATSNRHGPFLAVLIVKGDGVGLGADLFHRHIEHPPGFRVKRQKDRIGLAPLFAQRGQHHLHDLIIFFNGASQHLVKLARAIKFGGRVELILKAKGIQEPAQHGIVVMAKALVGAKGIRHRGQRFLQMWRQAVGIGHIARHLAHPVQIIGKTDELGWNIADHLKGVFDHGCPGHLAKGADMRQARGAIAGFEQDIALFWRALGITFEHPAGFFKRPGLALESGVAQIRHCCSPSAAPVAA